MLFDGVSRQLPDIDPQETAEWLDAFDDIVETRGRSRARFLLMKLLDSALNKQVDFPSTVSTPYVNTIPPDAEPWFPGDEEMERRIRRLVRWNAAVMVTRANARSEGIGGHLSTYASSASLYEVGFNHFFRGRTEGFPGDQVFFQGHASPGIYARAFVEGRLTEEQMDNFRHEIGGNGLPSYPHPRVMPDFWEFPTVSMGLGPLMAIYQAHFNKYLFNRHLVDTSQSRVWAFVGDGEMDEPEARAALAVAGREQLDNLIMVVNCNLQRLDGPVRGNGKVIQEFEALFRGAGWNVIKVIWGSRWDELLARDVDGVLLNKMNTTLDGDFQKYATESGAYIREHFFGPDPRLRKLVEHLSDDDLVSLPRGGHDYRKLYAAYKVATEHTGSPTVILAKTVKGWTLGPEIEARNATHQIKKMTKAQLRAFRDRIHLTEEIPDSALEADLPPYYRPPEDSDVAEYLRARRQALGGYIPHRTTRAKPLPSPKEKAFNELLAGSGSQEFSTTMAFARLLRGLVRDVELGPRIVPIVPDEARTFGLEPLISEVGIYSTAGQRYTPVDAGLILSYQERVSGQILEEGITEAGAMATTIAAATSYATWSEPMIPFYLFYSMFGFQRTGDLMWAMGDIRGRGFLLGCTAGRTTLMGEGLQHCDGHSHILASTIPNVSAYDPAFAYELAIIVEDGIKRMYGPNPEDRFWYITLYNENYSMPPLPEGERGTEVRQGILKGMYQFAGLPEGASLPSRTVEDGSGPDGEGHSSPAADREAPLASLEGARYATLLFSGPAWRAVMQARDMLAEDWNVMADAWSVTSYKELREEALSTERWNRLHPTEPPRTPYVTTCLASGSGPIVAVTDFMKALPDQVARFAPRKFIPLGTDGFGRSDSRDALRRYFEVDAAHIVVAVLYGLMEMGQASGEEVAKAITMYGVDPEAVDPRTI